MLCIISGGGYKNGISRKTLFALYAKSNEEKPDRLSGAALNQQFQRLLMYLQSDFYIEEVKEDHFDFSSRLIKTWWKKYYGFEYGEE